MSDFDPWDEIQREARSREPACWFQCSLRRLTPDGRPSEWIDWRKSPKVGDALEDGWGVAIVYGPACRTCPDCGQRLTSPDARQHAKYKGSCV